MPASERQIARSLGIHTGKSAAIVGRLDDTTGEVSYGDDGDDLLSRIAVMAPDKDGQVIAARPDAINGGLERDRRRRAAFPLS